MTLIRNRSARLGWPACLALATAGTVASCYAIAWAVRVVLNVA